MLHTFPPPFPRHSLNCFLSIQSPIPSPTPSPFPQPLTRSGHTAFIFEKTSETCSIIHSSIAPQFPQHSSNIISPFPRLIPSPSLQDYRTIPTPFPPCCSQKKRRFRLLKGRVSVTVHMAHVTLKAPWVLGTTMRILSTLSSSTSCSLVSSPWRGTSSR